MIKHNYEGISYAGLLKSFIVLKSHHETPRVRYTVQESPNIFSQILFYSHLREWGFIWEMWTGGISLLPFRPIRGLTSTRWSPGLGDLGLLSSPDLISNSLIVGRFLYFSVSILVGLLGNLYSHLEPTTYSLYGLDFHLSNSKF